MKLKTILVGAALMASSCGGDGTFGVGGNGANLFQGGSAAGVLTTLTTFIQTNPMTGMPTDTTPPLPAKASIYDNCRTWEIGTSTSDDHYRVVYNCNKIIQGNDIITWKGTLGAKVNDPTDYTKGYRQDYDLIYENVSVNDPNSIFSDSWKGFNELRSTSTQIIFETDLELAIVMKPHAPPVDWSWRRAFKYVYTPDDMSNPELTGALAFEGLYGIKGKIGGAPNGVDYGITNVTFELKSKDLRYDSTCLKGFDSGTITFKDGAGNGITLEYHCTSVSATYNGRALTWY